MLTDADDLALNVETTSDKDLPTRDLVSPGLDDTSRLLSPGLDDSYHHPGGLLSPDNDSHYPNSPHSTTNSLDLIDYISNGKEGFSLSF